MSRAGKIRGPKGPSGGSALLLLYPLIAVLTFPTLGLLVWGHDGLVYAHDLLDIPRSGVFDDWVRFGPSLWNTHVAAGNVALAQQAISPLAIDVPIGLVVGPFWSLAVNGWLLAASAGISMHLFLRDSLRISTAAVVVGATLFTFSFWHPIIGFVIPLTPLVLWLGERMVRPHPERWRFALAHVMAGAFMLYNGQSQLVVFAALLELVYLLATKTGRRQSVVVGWVAVWAGAFALYAPVLITQLLLVGESQRSSWRPNRGPLPAIVASAARLYSAVVLGVPLKGWGSSPSIYGTFYFGAAGLPLLTAALLGRLTGARRFMVIALLALPLLDILASTSWALQAALGPLQSFQIVRVRHLFIVPLVASAAIGLDSLPLVWADRRSRVLIVLAAFPVAATTLAAGVEAVVHRRDVLMLREEALGWVLGAAAGVAGIALCLWLILILRRPGSARAVALLPAALLLLLVGERVLYAPTERLLDGQLASWSQAHEPTDAQLFLLRQDRVAEERVLALGEDANRSGAVGLQQVDGYQTIYPAAYQQLFGAVIRPTLDAAPRRADYFDHWGNRAIAFGPAVDPELVALLGVRWLYARNPPSPTFNRSLYRGLPWVPTVPGMIKRYEDAEAVVYEVPTAFGKAWLAGSVEPVTDSATAVAFMAKAGIDELAGTAWVTGDIPDEAAALTGLDAGEAGRADVVAYQPDRVVIAIDADRDAMLILGDTWSPGWVADVDGIAASVLRTDAALRGVAVPAGEHTVTMEYRPTATYAGAAVALAALAAVAAVIAGLKRHDGRATPKS